jgi:hypothetical protein
MEGSFIVWIAIAKKWRPSDALTGREKAQNAKKTLCILRFVGLFRFHQSR